VDIQPTTPLRNDLHEFHSLCSRLTSGWQGNVRCGNRPTFPPRTQLLAVPATSISSGRTQANLRPELEASLVESGPGALLLLFVELMFLIFSALQRHRAETQRNTNRAEPEQEKLSPKKDESHDTRTEVHLRPRRPLCPCAPWISLCP
jgi:hypothetical protein